MLKVAFCSRGRSEAFLSFLGYPVNDALVATTSLLETRRNHKRQNQRSNEGRGKIPFSRPKIAALTTQHVPEHCYDESTSPGYAVVTNVYGGLAAPDDAKHTGNNAG